MYCVNYTINNDKRFLKKKKKILKSTRCYKIMLKLHIMYFNVIILVIMIIILILRTHVRIKLKKNLFYYHQLKIK